MRVFNSLNIFFIYYTAFLVFIIAFNVALVAVVALLLKNIPVSYTSVFFFLFIKRFVWQVIVFGYSIHL